MIINVMGWIDNIYDGKTKLKKIYNVKTIIKQL